MRPVYIFLVIISVLVELQLPVVVCGRSRPGYKCVPRNTNGTGCIWVRVRRKTPQEEKRGYGHVEKYQGYRQVDEERAMQKLTDETRRFLAGLLKDGRQEKQKSDGSNQNVYGLDSYEYDFQRYF